MYYTKDMAPVKLPSHFMCKRDVLGVSTLAQNMVKYIKRDVQAAVLANQLGERVGLMSSRDASDMAHHGMIEDCAVSTHDLYR